MATSLYEHLKSCQLCPHRCSVDRTAGKLGYCRAGLGVRVFRHGAHFGEEPPISGTRGSGTIFFSNCTLDCIYCQNHPWSQGGKGVEFDTPGLRAIFQQLYTQGCHNWNLVSPTPWLPQIEEAVAPLLYSGIRLPFVYNTSGYESIKTLKAFGHLVDIALIDLRYATALSAAEGSGALDYVETARSAVAQLWQMLGALQFDQQGIAQKGVICRILALPGRVYEAIDNLQWLARAIGTEIHLSVMSQYTPLHRALRRAGWDRTITAAEYQLLTEAVDDLGFVNGWVQDLNDTVPTDLLGQNMPAGQSVVGV